MAILAVHSREQEHQWERERTEKRRNPCPAFDTASTTLGNSAGKIDRTNKYQ
jgi:hypothetical protein